MTSTFFLFSSPVSPPFLGGVFLFSSVPFLLGILLLNFGTFSEMWGVNGKNHTFSMGHYWLVALLFFPSAVNALEWDRTDKDNLASVASYSEDSYDLLSSLELRVDSLNDLLQPYFYLSPSAPNSWYWQLVLASESIREIESILSGWNPSGGGGDTVVNVTVEPEFDVNVELEDIAWIRNFIDTNKRSDTNVNTGISGGLGIRVVSDGIESRLDRLTDVAGSNTNYWEKFIALYTNRVASGTVTNFFIPMDANFFIPMNSGTTWIRQNVGNYYDAMRSYQDYLISGSPLARDAFTSAMLEYGSWRWSLLQTLALINPDSSIWIDNNSLGGGRFNVRVKSLLVNPTDTTASNFLLSYRDNYYNQYSTLPTRLMISNYLYSAVQNGVVNTAVIKQLVSKGEFDAISGGDFSNVVQEVVGGMANKAGISNAGTFFENGATNFVADITTNDYHNSYFSAYQDDFKTNRFASKVSSFDFSSKFDESIKPFLDEINAGSGTDWQINLGNVTLGDFSYSIPTITVPHNETFLGFVDQALNFMKVILSVGFFLVLWRELEHCVET